MHGPQIGYSGFCRFTGSLINQEQFLGSIDSRFEADKPSPKAHLQSTSLLDKKSFVRARLVDLQRYSSRHDTAAPDSCAIPPGHSWPPGRVTTVGRQQTRINTRSGIFNST